MDYSLHFHTFQRCGYTGVEGVEKITQNHIHTTTPIGVWGCGVV